MYILARSMVLVSDFYSYFENGSCHGNKVNFCLTFLFCDEVTNAPLHHHSQK